MAQEVARIHGKDEVTGSNPVKSSRNLERGSFFYSCLKSDMLSFNCIDISSISD